MVFSSISFLYYFLPCVLIIYFLVPACFRNSVLLVASLFFYGWGEPVYLLVMAASIIWCFIFGILIERKRGEKKAGCLLAISILPVLSALFFFKYADFTIANINKIAGLSLPLLKIALPIGISFYTFQLISYLADIYMGRENAQKNIIDFAMYISMFPQLVAGPIVLYGDISGSLKNRKISISGISYGIKRFVIGLSKKVMIANVLGELVDIYKETESKSVLFVWLYAAACTLQLYFDFSGYSDMAIGLGRIFGFVLPENFDYPYTSGSVTEFWRRWHMTLGGWFRNYVYIPLGGNRVPMWKWIRNILIVWMATGLWHGAAWNFIIWGLFFAGLLIIEKKWLLKYLKKTHVLKHIYLIFIVMISFIIFDAVSVGDAFSTLYKMAGGGDFLAVDVQGVYYLKSYFVILLIAIIGATPYPAKLWKKLNENKYTECIINIFEPILLALLLLASTSFLIAGSFNPFLYFRF